LTSHGENGYMAPAGAYPAGGSGFTDDFDGQAGGYGGGRAYDRAQNGYGGWDAYAQPAPELASPAGYLGRDEYPGFDSGTSPVLVAPDLVGEWWRQPTGDERAGRDARGDGAMIGAVTGFLSAAVAVGVATLTAAFVRPQAPPVGVIGGVVLDRIPAGLRDTMMAHLGVHGGTVLLLGMIAVIAIATGGAARRRASMGVAWLAAAGLLGAFVAVTRPESRVIDVVPLAVGVGAGIMALLWLARASAPLASARPAYGSRRGLR
jgi:hypothetical protein